MARRRKTTKTLKQAEKQADRIYDYIKSRRGAMEAGSFYNKRLRPVLDKMANWVDVQYTSPLDEDWARTRPVPFSQRHPNTTRRNWERSREVARTNSTKQQAATTRTSKNKKKTVTQALDQLDRIYSGKNLSPEMDLYLDDIYGVLQESLAEDNAQPSDDWRKVYDKARGISQTTSLNDTVTTSLGSLAYNARHGGNKASTASKGNSNS